MADDGATRKLQRIRSRKNISQEHEVAVEDGVAPWPCPGRGSRITYDQSITDPAGGGTMATLTQVTLTCDVCGNEEDIQTRTVGLDGQTYEIDLCPKDSKNLSKTASGYVSKARKDTARRSARRNGHRPRSRAHATAIGDGAKASVMKISGRGRASGSTHEEAKTSLSKQRAAKADGATTQPASVLQEKAKPTRRPKPQKAKTASKQAAKTAGGPQQEKGIYVYGIFPADIEMAVEMPGVGEHAGQIRVVRSDSLAALISEVDLSSRLGSPEDLNIHMEILDGAASEVPVLPLGFGTILTSEEAVAEDLLAAHRDEFHRALEELEGRAEFLVKGRYVEQAGTVNREDDTRALQEAMEGHCVACVVREPTHELEAVHVAFLVETDEERDMEQVIEDLARDWAGRIEIQLVGPMAAYDFVETTKSAE